LKIPDPDSLWQQLKQKKNGNFESMRKRVVKNSDKNPQKIAKSKLSNKYFI
jgi:hypothetical protein